MRVFSVIVVLLVISMCKSKPDFAQSLSRNGTQVAFSLNVLLVNDPKFQILTRKDAEQSLQAAYQTIAERYPGMLLSTNRLDITGSEDFFSEYKAEEKSPERYFSLGPGSEQENENRFRKGLPQIIDKLKETDPDLELRNIPAGLRKEVRQSKKPYLRYAELLFETQLDRIRLYQSKRVRRGPLLDGDPQHSLNSWVNTMYKQNDYDLVLTNTFIMDDDLTAMDPETVLFSYSHGGLATLSPENSSLEGWSVFASFFFLYDGPTFFNEELAAQKLSRRKRNQIAGTNLIAHELAHYLFLLPDFTNHPEYCLLNESAYDILGDYKTYTANKRPCPVCRPYVQARLKALKGYVDYHQGRYGRAKVNFKEAKILPPEVDDYIAGPYIQFLDNLIEDTDRKTKKESGGKVE